MGSQTSLKTSQRGGLQPPQPSPWIRLWMLTYNHKPCLTLKRRGQDHSLKKRLNLTRRETLSFGLFHENESWQERNCFSRLFRMSKVFFYYPELVCSVLNYGFVDNLILRQSIKKWNTSRRTRKCSRTSGNKYHIHRTFYADRYWLNILIYVYLFYTHAACHRGRDWKWSWRWHRIRWPRRPQWKLQLNNTAGFANPQWLFLS